MDATATNALQYRRWLPFWAVLQTDLRQTCRSWVFRIWVLAVLLVAVGYLLYRFGVYREAGLLQSASLHSSDLFRGISFGSLALIVVLTVSSISSERGTLADSILSRGISRYQYFFAKLHARLLAILLAFGLVTGAMLISFRYLLTDDITLSGAASAIIIVGSMLMAIIALGVTVGALANSTVVGITFLWVLLYGAGFLLTLLPASFPSPERMLARLPGILKGEYDTAAITEWVLICGAITLVASIAGSLGFARKDV